MKTCLRLAALLLILPTLVLGGIIANNEYNLSHAKTWRVKITGYDPRDLLYGHYLNFRFDWGNNLGNICNAGEANCCLCFNDQAPNMATPAIAYQACGMATKQCVSAIPLSNKREGAFNPLGQQQFFIPEAAAPQLENILRDRNSNVSLDIRVTPSGRYAYGALYIDDIEWHDYLRQHPEAGVKKPQAVTKVYPPSPTG